MPRVAGLLGGLGIPIGLLLAMEAISMKNLPGTSGVIDRLLPAMQVPLLAMANAALLMRSWETRSFQTTWLLAFLCSLSAGLGLIHLIFASTNIRADGGTAGGYTLTLTLLMAICASLFCRVAIVGGKELRLPFHSYTRHPRRGFTEPQVQLVLVNLLLVWWVIAGAGLFTWLEGWMRFEEGVYFTIVSLTTIGLGDLTLRRPLSRAVFPLYAVPGLVLFGVTIYAIRQVILEFLAVRLSLHVYKLLSAWSFSQEVVDISPPPSDVDSERSVDKNDDSSLNGSSKEEVEAAGNAALLRLRQSISQHLQCEPLLAAQQPLQPPLLPSPSPAVAVAVPTPPALHRSLTIPTAYHYDYTAKSPLHPRRTLSTAPGAHLRTTILRSPTTISSLSSTILTPLRTVAGDLLPDGTAAAASPSSITLPIPAAAISESSMTAVNTSKLLRALRSILFRHLRYAMFATLLYLLMFAWLMARLEQWPFWDSFYFGFTALTSIGYGDLVPRTAAGRHAFLGFISVGMGMVTFLGSVLAEFLLSQWKIHIETIATGR